MRYVQAGLLVLVLASLFLFALQNTQAVTVKFIAWGWSAPLALAVVSAYVVGMLSGGAVVWALKRLM